MAKTRRIEAGRPVTEWRVVVSCSNRHLFQDVWADTQAQALRKAITACDQDKDLGSIESLTIACRRVAGGPWIPEGESKPERKPGPKGGCKHGQPLAQNCPQCVSETWDAVQMGKLLKAAQEVVDNWHTDSSAPVATDAAKVSVGRIEALAAIVREIKG